MQPIRAVLESLPVANGPELAWAMAVDPALAAGATVETARQGVLTVRVRDAEHRRALMSVAEEIAARMNQMLGKNGIRKIEFQIRPAAGKAGIERHAWR